MLSYREGGEDVVNPFTIVNDTLTVETGGGELTLIFVRSGDSAGSGATRSLGGSGAGAGGGAGAGAGASGGAGADQGAGLAEKLAWWDGEWYGYWTIVSGRGYYETLVGGVWDCYAFIDTYEDGSATVLWFDDDVRLGDVDIYIDFTGYTVLGYAESIGGYLFNDPVQDEAWFISPDSSPHEHMIVIDEWHEYSSSDRFRYKAFLRPWGMLWDDVPAGERPPDYDWYLGVKHITLDELVGGVGSSGGSGQGGSGGSNMSGTVAESEIKSMGGRTGLMTAVYPEGWYDHSMPDIMTGFMAFSASPDPFDYGYPNIRVRCSTLIADDLVDAIMHDGIPLSFMFDSRSWDGVYNDDGFGVVELLTEIGEGSYVSIEFHGLDPNDEIILMVIRNFRARWN
jgi:hypothetical protein